MTQLQALRQFYRNLRPYSHQDYTKDAKSIIVTRVLSGRFDHSAIYNRDISDPSHAAQWSVLSRKRKNGVKLLTLYVLAIRYDMDMTATLGQRILEGIYGSGMSNNFLIQAFSTKGRTATDKSEDWAILDKVVSENREYFLEKMARSKSIIVKNKDLSWDLASVELSQIRHK